MAKLAQKPLTSAYCAGQLHLSEAYFNDLLEIATRTHAQLPSSIETYRNGKGEATFLRRIPFSNRS